MRLRIEHIIHYTIILIVLLFITIFLFLFFCRIDESVTIYGQIEPEEIFPICAPKPGFIEKVYVKDGATVSIGDTLFKISNPDEEYERQLLQLKLTRAERELIQLQSSLELLKCGSFETQTTRNLVPYAEARYQEAERKYQIARALYEKEYLSSDEFNKISTDYQVYRSEYIIFQKEISLQMKLCARQIQEKIEEIRLISSEIATLNKNMKINFIISNRNGPIRFNPESDLLFRKVNLGERLAYIADRNKIVFTGQLPEAYIDRVKIGQDVFVSLRILSSKKGRFLKGVVKNIRLAPDKGNFVADLNITGIPTEINLEPGLTGKGRIIMARNKRIIEQIFSLISQQGG
ncbi:MAG: HlyD family efflux transporter periplasmic adaptor subunit [candidate division WOR-3 bacterium]